MPVIIRNGQFVEDLFIEAGGVFVQLDQMALTPHDFDRGTTGVDVPPDTRPSEIEGLIGSISAIRIMFPSFVDGRGFSLARRLRRMGFSGLLRAKGHVLADQYPLALRSGFDEVEIPNEQAGRQPQAQWSDAFSRIDNAYLERLKSGEVIEAA